MELAVLGWPDDGPTLRLDHERFAYAGKFVVSDTGKAVARTNGDVVAAVAFSPDRTDESTLRLRYVTVRRDRQGAGIGPRLLRFVADRARSRGYGDVLIAVNNPYAYEAAYRAGFAWTGEETGIAELVLAYAPADGADSAAYRDGLDVFAERDLPASAREFAERTRRDGPPSVVPVAADDPRQGGGA